MLPSAMEIKKAIRKQPFATMNSAKIVYDMPQFGGHLEKSVHPLPPSIRVTDRPKKIKTGKVDKGFDKLDTATQIDLWNARNKEKFVSRDTVFSLVDMPIEKAAKELRIGPTFLKKICRHYGMMRWPYRKLLALCGKMKGSGRKALDQDDVDVLFDIARYSLSNPKRDAREQSETDDNNTNINGISSTPHQGNVSQDPLTGKDALIQALVKIMSQVVLQDVNKPQQPKALIKNKILSLSPNSRQRHSVKQDEPTRVKKELEKQSLIPPNTELTDDKVKQFMHAYYLYNLALART